MPIIGIEHEAVGFLSGLERIAQQIRLLDGNQRILSAVQYKGRSVPLETSGKMLISFGLRSPVGFNRERNHHVS